MLPRSLSVASLFVSAVLLAAAARAQTAAPPAGMALVAAGPFTQGAADGNPDEAPMRQVTLPAFYVDRHEVTVAQYAEFVKSAGHPAPPDWPNGVAPEKRLQQPVVNVSWYDANAYARWAGKRLPTEAEWEKAARGADGRNLPWGGAWAPGRANMDEKEGDRPLQAVGTYPTGASPYGALDMLGNAWEWTADWYQPYPGNPAPYVAYGEKYRVVRGGGSIDFYPPLNGKRLSIRGRIQPFGRYDGVGFRCVRDADGPLRVAPSVQPPAAREKPVPPKVETPQEVAARYRGGVPILLSGGSPSGGTGVATFGVPFPEGVLRDTEALRTGTALQARPLATWRDGSIRWALLDVQTGAEKLSLRWNGGGAAPLPRQALSVDESAAGVTIKTGTAVLHIRKADTRWLSLEGPAGRVEGPEDRVSASEEKGGAVPLRVQPPSRVTVEDRGPLRARVRVEGWLVDTEGKPVVRYRCRVDTRAGSPSVNLVHTFTHLSPRPMLMVNEYTLHFKTALPEDHVEFGGDRGTLSGGPGARLEQLSDTSYSLQPNGGVPTTVTGTRAKGWLGFGRKQALLVAVKHFWEQFPKALRREEDGVTVALWTGKTAFDADQGLSKTHELLLSAGAEGPRRQLELTAFQQPRFGVAPADWYCASRGLGVLAPYSLSRYPQYETEVEAAADLMVRERPYGMRHFGDNYFGGPYKGINSFQDLEYDVSYNFFMQFARTGARKYLDTGIVQARHGGDIDMKHDAGPQWKHSPRHTTTEAELGHVFLRGLVASTWLTGDPEGLENAKILGDWLIKVVSNPRSQGNERQIGWSLYALTGIYEATWDDRYLQAMKANVDRLLAGQDNLGRFSIRYDNRISFFYGITLSGFVKYYEVTGDERIADSIQRIVTRLHGFYPEYAGRTLEGLAWLYTRTGDPEVRMTCQRTYETTMAWRPFDIGGMTIFTTRFLPSVETLGLSCPAEWKIPSTGPVEDGMHRHHYRAASGTLYLQATATRKPVDLVFLRHVGLSQATVRVRNAAGTQVAALDLPASGEPVQYGRLSLKPGGPYRVEFASESTRAWDLITEQETRRVFHAPDWKNLEALTPRVYFRVAEGATAVDLQLEAEKEGFKGCVVYDPDGNVAAVLAKFVDFEDTKRYSYPLRVAVPAGQAGKLWSMDLQQVSVSRATGIGPYFSTAPAAYFQPAGATAARR